MDQRDCLDLVGNVLRTAEGRKLLADTLGTAVVECRIVAGGAMPRQAPGRPGMFEVRAHTIFSTRQRNQSGERKLLFDFDNLPQETLDSYRVRHVTRNGVVQYGWHINPAEAFLVGIGVDFGSALRQSFTPTVDVASRVQATYYESDPSVPDQTTVLLTNDSEDAFVVHEGQLLGHVQFLQAVNNVRLTLAAEPKG